MAIFTACCGCITVESGSTLIGIFSFMTSAVALVTKLPIIHQTNRHDDHLEKVPKIFGENYNLNTTLTLHRLTYMLLTILVTINMVASFLLLMGVKHRNRFLLLPWMLWTAVAITVCQIWMIFTRYPIFLGDLPYLVLYIWAELCVISHYQNLRDGITEEDIIERRRQREERFIEGFRRGGGGGVFGRDFMVTTSTTARGSGRANGHPCSGFVSRENASQETERRLSLDLPPPYPGSIRGSMDLPVVLNAEVENITSGNYGQDERMTNLPPKMSDTMNVSPPPSYDCFVSNNNRSEVLKPEEAIIDSCSNNNIESSAVENTEHHGTSKVEEDLASKKC